MSFVLELSVKLVFRTIKTLSLFFFFLAEKY